MKFVNDILTGADNTTYDGGRVLCFLSHIVYFTMAFTSYITSHPWPPVDFATGVSAMAVGFGVHFYMDKGNQPNA